MYFSRSGTPSTDIDTSFFANLDIKGYVAADGRGTVSGTASGADSSFKWVVHWYDTRAIIASKSDHQNTGTMPMLSTGHTHLQTVASLPRP